VQGAQYKLFGKMGLILEQVESKLGHRPETTGERVAGMVTEKAAVEDAEQEVPKVVAEKTEVVGAAAAAVVAAVVVAVVVAVIPAEVQLVREEAV